MFSYFLTFIAANQVARLADDDRKLLADMLRSIPGLRRAHLLTPAAARDRYIDDGPQPMLTVQLYFERLETLEEAAGADGALLSLVRSPPQSLAHAQVSHQAMWTRRYPTSVRPPSDPSSRRSCSFLVHYHGEPEDLNQWLTYYLGHHPPVMGRFPAIREIEAHTRVDWVDALPCPRVHYFQRNKIVFDSPAALEEALHSSVREELKADRAHFPPFSGGNMHHALATETLVGPVFMS